MSTLEEFRQFREQMNERILASDNREIKRFFALDTRAYEEGALPVKTKELLGLVASMVLRCDDCITYHVVRCKEEGVSRPEFLDAFNIGLVVGGSIVIPHLRRAIERLDELDEIVPAYACAIHKRQGSEYPSVVIPVHTQHYIMLQRNVLYTGVTRAQKLVTLVGSRRALALAVEREDQSRRITGLRGRLREPG